MNAGNGKKGDGQKCEARIALPVRCPLGKFRGACILIAQPSF